jgi:putative oxidoreductase
MKHYATIARSLIALLFVVAGVQKLMGFAGSVGYIGALGLPMPTILAILVIIIEVPVALLFAYGYKVREMGWILGIYTVLTILVAHRDWSQGANMIMALKNLSIVGGIMLAVCCKGKHHD